jgi:catechol 2,3-dioxygenase
MQPARDFDMPRNAVGETEKEKSVISNRLIAHLAHIEFLTPEPDKSLEFFRDVVGLEYSGTDGRSSYLRGWGEWHYHSVQLTQSEKPGLGRIGWRAASPEALEQAVANLEAASAGEGWSDDSVGHGASFHYFGPGGHQHEIFWEVDDYQPPPELAPEFPDRPQRFIPRGIAPRMIDHVTVMTADPMGDVRWYEKNLGSTFTEWTVLDDVDVPVFCMSTNNEKSHDLGLIMDRSGVPGRLHHVAFWVDTRDELHRAADILLNQGVAIETGPGRHGMGEQDYLYFKEPGGNRIEINTGGYRLYVPDWEARKWTPAQGSNTFYRNTPLPESMLEGTPLAAPKEDAGIAANPWDAASVR